MLAQLRPRITSGGVKSITLATGNQSGDMDSVVSAIVHSLFSNIKYKSKNEQQQHSMIPFLNFEKKDLRLRKDIVLCLESAHISADSLFFIDDLKDETFTSIVKDVQLLDHNVPQGSVAKFIENNELIKVTGIIDHHADEGQFLDSDPRIIGVSGSCSSMVWNYWKTQLNFDDVKEDLSQIVSLLVAPLVLDTSNLSSKMTQEDWKAVEGYKEYYGDVFEQRFTALQTARSDIEGLSLGEIFNKDYKLFECEIGTNVDTVLKIGISSVVKSIEWLLENHNSVTNLQNEIISFIKKNELDALVIMTSYTQDKEFQRQIIFSTDKTQVSLLLRLVIDSIIEDLRLEEIPLEEDTELFLEPFTQLNIGASRKQVAPLIKEAFKRL